MRKIKLISEFFPRSYQESIFLNSLDKNTLVVLPTGLGKTIIALMLAVYYFNKNNKKVLFLAPTKPLVEQQKLSFENFFENKEKFNFQVLTGLISPKKRIPIYEEADFIFSTPQLIENDIINNIIDIKIFGFVIIDEVHRAKGGYAYNFLAEEFEKSGAKILGLSASPGTTKEEIMELIESMKIEHIEIKKYDDLDVKEYINKTHLEKIQVEMPLEFQDISSRLNFCFEKKIKKLQELNIFQGKNSSNISKKNILDLQMELRTKIASGENYPEIWKAISIAAGLLKLMHGIELFESQEISASYNFFNNFFRDGGDNSKAAEDLRFDIDFRDAYQIISNLYQKGVLHPKILELRKLVYNNIF
ncbi:DEAD/DEAH box helicase, partial [bacterium]|nr:DEAD/DEAH box helicase [bacterium]